MSRLAISFLSVPPQIVTSWPFHNSLASHHNTSPSHYRRPRGLWLDTYPMDIQIWICLLFLVFLALYHVSTPQYVSTPAKRGQPPRPLDNCHHIIVHHPTSTTRPTYASHRVCMGSGYRRTPPSFHHLDQHERTRRRRERESERGERRGWKRERRRRKRNEHIPTPYHIPVRTLLLEMNV